jgi:hypothetical protein
MAGKMSKIIVGIDPDKGWAVCEHSITNKTILDAGTVKNLEIMIQKIKELYEKYCITEIRIEKPSNKKVYPRKGQNYAIMLKIAHNVGENRAKADAIFYYCRGIGLNAVYCEPMKSLTKLSSEQVERLTSYSKRTSEHARDAIMLSWV